MHYILKKKNCGSMKIGDEKDSIKVFSFKIKNKLEKNFE